MNVQSNSWLAPLPKTKVVLLEGSKRTSEPQLSPQSVLVISRVLLPVSKITWSRKKKKLTIHTVDLSGTLAVGGLTGIICGGVPTNVARYMSLTQGTNGRDSPV